MRTLKEEEAYKKFIADSLEALLEEGRQEGMQEGIRRVQESVASKLLKDGFKIDQIMQLTGLNKQRIEELAVAIH